MKPRSYSAHLAVVLIFLTSATALVAGPKGQGQPVPRFTWVRTETASESTNPSGAAFGVAFDSQGNVIAAGRLSDGQSSEFTVVKYTPNGALVWRRAVGGGSGGATAVAVDGADNVVAVGGRQVNGVFQSLVARWDPQGNLLWTATFSPDSISQSGATDVALDSRGNVLVSGSIVTGPGSVDWAVAKFHEPDGALLWVQRGRGVAGFGNNGMSAVAVDSQDNVAATGFGQTAAGPFDFFVVRLEESDGEVLWSRAEGNPNDFDQGVDVAIDHDDNVVASGFLGDNGGRRFVVAKFARDSGNRVWLGESFGPLTGGSGAFAVGVDSQNKPVGMGAAQTGGILHAAAAKYNDANGNEIWSRLIPPPVPGGFAFANDGVLDFLDNVVMGGGSGGSSPNFFEDFTVYKLDPDGKPVWTRILPSNGDGEVLGVAADALGNIAAGGYRTVPVTEDVQFTVAYVDQVSPSIGKCSVTPRSIPAAGGPVAFDAFITDQQGVASAIARVSLPNRTPVEVPLPGDGDVFHGVFDAPPNPGTTLTYHVMVIATDFAGNTTSADCGTFTVAPGGRPTTIGSARVRLYRNGRLVTQGLFRRISGNFTGQFLGLQPGQYRADADGYASVNGTGRIIARGMGTATVTARRTTVLRLNWGLLPGP